MDGFLGRASFWFACASSNVSTSSSTKGAFGRWVPVVAVACSHSDVGGVYPVWCMTSVLVKANMTKATQHHKKLCKEYISSKSSCLIRGILLEASENQHTLVNLNRVFVHQTNTSLYISFAAAPLVPSPFVITRGYGFAVVMPRLLARR